MAQGAARTNGGKQSRIQTENRALIMQAALDVFSTDGYRGATVDRIAERAGMSKTNLLYYYPSKEEIYRSAIEQTVESWLDPFEAIDPDGDPIEELRRYITVKLKCRTKTQRPHGCLPTRCSAVRRWSASSCRRGSRRSSTRR